MCPWVTLAIMDIQTPLGRAMAAAEINDTELAKRLGCTSQHINRARRGKKMLSPQMAMAVERELGGHITRHDLRPDVYPNSVRDERVAA